jgi:hypothetical protein
MLDRLTHQPEINQVETSQNMWLYYHKDDIKAPNYSFIFSGEQHQGWFLLRGLQYFVTTLEAAVFIYLLCFYKYFVTTSRNGKILNRARPELLPLAAPPPAVPASGSEQPLARLALANLMIERAAKSADPSPTADLPPTFPPASFGDRIPPLSNADLLADSIRVHHSGLTRHASDPSHKVF